MGAILFEKTYSEPCEDMDDILSFSNLTQTSSIFCNAAEKDRILFNRFAAKCALLAEELKCKLTAEHCTDGDERILFHFSGECFSFSVNDPLPFTDLMRYGTLNICTEYNTVIITATFFI